MIVRLNESDGSWAEAEIPEYRTLEVYQLIKDIVGFENIRFGAADE